MSCSKCLLILFNSLLLLCGIAIAVSASLLATNMWPSELDFVFNDISLQYWGWGLLGVGCVCIILAIIGLVGACSGNRCFLWTYIIILALFVLAEIGIGIYLLGQKSNLSWTESWNKLVTDAVIAAYPSNSEAFHSAFNCPNDPSTPNAAEICSLAVLQSIKNDWWIIGWVCVGLGVFQIILIILSCVAISHTSRKRQQQIQQSQQSNDIEMQFEKSKAQNAS